MISRHIYLLVVFSECLQYFLNESQLESVDGVHISVSSLDGITSMCISRATNSTQIDIIIVLDIMTASSPWYCIQWNNHYSNLLSFYDELLCNETFADVTLVLANNVIVKCHKLVLVTCSNYFRTLFLDFPCMHQTVVLKDIKYSEMKIILEFMYHGKTNVKKDQMGDLLKVAEALQVKGLMIEDSSRSKNSAIHDPCHGNAVNTMPPSVININIIDEPTHSNSNLSLHSSAGYSTTHSYADVYMSKDENSSPQSCVKVPITIK